MNLLFDLPEWLPPHTVRYSKRARHLNLKICPRKGLQIIIPPYFNTAEISGIIQKNRTWIERNWREPSMNSEDTLLPNQINFASLSESWSIEYRADNKASRVIVIGVKQLLVTGRVQNVNLVKRLLFKWVYQYAELKLIEWFKVTSMQSGLSYSRITIGNANTLWGSCSSKKQISLNCKLLFLPAELVEYVMLHELCHTVHLNHSKEFWTLLEKFVPHCLDKRKKLRKVSHLIPNWFE